ncbi:Exosome complex protein.07 [Ceratocystis platani]|uniref:Exosome complex protein n=1 Tax=Ceratocystis fimbriata f. sp. platani TaxID=88771 RepID=A0A0F8CRE8_CERFI|nr:Exosome complex protein.07 [Ceratocystis platani]
MSVRDITKDLNKLDKQLDALDDALKPLLKALNESASSMLLLDRAKLFTLANYALETLIFAGLRVDGADAMDHPVFKTELMRVKQYFAKIEAVEKPTEAEAATSQQQQPAVRLNTEAATRMIKHGLCLH